MTDDPFRHWESEYETGVLWRFTGLATPLSYTVLPQILTFRSPLIGTARPLAGGDLVIRNRISLLVEPVLAGPEHHYFGVAGSGILEWWNGRRTHVLFLAAGGGFGGLDSKGYRVPGAQGQDFNFNWFVYPGMRFIWKKNLNASFGIYFQHVSNSGLNPVNPGLNAIGPMLGIGWRY